MSSVVRPYLYLLGVAVLLSAAAPCSAGLVLSIKDHDQSSSTQTTLSPGDKATFDVILGGLETNSQQLGNLSVEVDFDASLLGTPSKISPGGIIGDSDDFFGAQANGAANGTFSIFFNSSSPITANGTFFSFDVTAQAPSGTNQGAFTFGSVAATDLDYNPIGVILGNNVSYQVVSAAPEPSTGLMGALAAVMAGACWARRARANRLSRDFSL